MTWKGKALHTILLTEGDNGSVDCRIYGEKAWEGHSQKLVLCSEEIRPMVAALSLMFLNETEAQ